LDVATTPAADTAETDFQGPTDVPDDADDEVIDLTEMAIAPETPAIEPGEETAPAYAEDDADEAVIDLLDVATTLESDLVETEPEVAAGKSGESVGPTEDEDDVIDLLDMSTAPAADTVPAETAVTDDFETPEEAAETAGPDNDFYWEAGETVRR
jgi:hypothetical protein